MEEQKNLNLAERYEQEKEKVKVLVCDECNKEFLLYGVQIKKYVIDDSAHKLHFVFSYFECPHCGQVYPVCIDDNYSDYLQSAFDLISNRIERNRRRGKEIKEKQLDTLRKRQKKISVYREKLMKMYSEAFTELVKKQNSELNSTMA